MAVPSTTPSSVPLTTAPVTTTPASHTAELITSPEAGNGIFGDVAKVSDEIITWGCLEGDETEVRFGTPFIVRAQVIDGGSMVTFPAPMVPSGSELESFACATAGTGDSLVVVYAMGLVVESKGLQPEHHQLELRSFDARTGKLVGQQSQMSSVPDLKDGSFELYGTTTSVIVGQGFGDKYGYGVVDAFTTELDTQWSRPGELLGATGNTVLIEQHDPATRATMTPDGVVYVLDAKTGAELSRLDYGAQIDGIERLEVMVITPKGYALERLSPLPGNGSDLRFTWIDGTMGTVLHTDITDLFEIDIDPFGESLLVNHNQVLDRAYVVYDLRTSKALLTITSDQSAGLSIRDIGLANGLLYVDNKVDSPVTDIETQEMVSSNWKYRPILRGDGHTIVAVVGPPARTSPVLECTYRDRYRQEYRNYGINGGHSTRIDGYYNCPAYRVVQDINGNFPGPNY